ncbi:hypothetical protein [Bacillus sp. Cr_A10]|uniref:hypothetical protein n=1 Tax=Bacillus sp. Cr_A10 TaxID=3033993 RepID=UPI0023DBF3CD|nr:hypothetical protein [Bacillus sp. Cr_A10]MDF2065057.1 hypothetical protein [Bacillus sp. Cr_A10]
MNTKGTDIEGISHSFIPFNNSRKIETLYIDLTKSEEELFSNLHRSNRKQINQSESLNFNIEVIKNPTISDVHEFRDFYNNFAKTVNTYRCGNFHVHTMNLLIKQNALIITRIVSDRNDVLCYRVYLTDGETALSLYSASHFRLKESKEEKRLLSKASRYLLWKNILFFKENNHQTYDMGGLTDNENIRKFKMEFGGEITDVYSGYEANSKVGKFVLWLRSKKMKKG